MTVASTHPTIAATWARSRRRGASQPTPGARAQASPRIGPVARALDRLTRRWTLDLFDVNLQLEAADIEAELRGGRR